MSPKLQFLCFLAAAVCFVLAALGGTKRGSATQPAVLVPLGDFCGGVLLLLQEP